ncbi:MAG: sigma-54 dependent transcriptional regulator [Candidatus Zixiibacteriota bacterium]
MILIVDDDSAVVSSLTLLLKQHGYATRAASTPGEARALCKRERFSLVLQDMNFSRETTGQEGLDLLAHIKADAPSTPIVLITAWGSISLAVQGIKAGAADFITKPWSNHQLLQVIRTALEVSTVQEAGRSEKNCTRAELDHRYDLTGIISEDSNLLKILELVGRIAPTDASVLITGETGTGKEIIAEAIYRNSRRNKAPYVKVNLGGISSSLFESEMFGHVKGAFTDARQDRQGRFEMAHGGTIFLDEVGDLDPACQVKLLRVLQDRTYEVLGASKPRTVNVRVISATNRDIPQMVADGQMREDLLYRLNLITLHLPALRERIGDIPLLVDYFLTNIGEAYHSPRSTISPAALHWLSRQPWPGNVRQFRQTIERAVLLSTHTYLDKADFELAMKMPAAEVMRPEHADPGSMTLEEMEKTMIVKCLTRYDGHLTRVAEALGLSRAALYRRLEKYGIRT